MIFYEQMYSGAQSRMFVWDMEEKDNREKDKGRLYLFTVEEKISDDINAEEFQDYLNGEEIRSRIAPYLYETADWETGNLKTLYHDFMYAQGETTLRNASIYIPVMPKEDKFQCILLFEEFKDSKDKESLYDLREFVVQPFVILPYWRQCKPKDTLWDLAVLYTGDYRNAGEISSNPLNHIKNQTKYLSAKRLKFHSTFF